MRPSLILAAALALAGASHATAEAVSHAVNMQASVPSICSFTDVSSTALTNVSATNSTFLVPIGVGEAHVAAETEATLEFQTASCNAFSTVKLTRAGFLLQGAQGMLPNGMLNQIDYTAFVQWGGGPLLASLHNGAIEAESQAAPRSAPLTLTINVPPTVGGTLVAGTYADTLTLSVTPN